MEYTQLGTLLFVNLVFPILVSAAIISVIILVLWMAKKIGDAVVPNVVKHPLTSVRHNSVRYKRKDKIIR